MENIENIENKLNEFEKKIKKKVNKIATKIMLFLGIFLSGLIAITLFIAVVFGGGNSLVPEVEDNKLSDLKRICTYCGIEWQEFLAYLIVKNNGEIENIDFEYEACDFLILRYKKIKVIMYDSNGNVTSNENLAVYYDYQIIEDVTLTNREDILNFHLSHGGTASEATNVIDNMKRLSNTRSTILWETNISPKNGMDFYYKLTEEQREWYDGLMTENLLISRYGDYYELSIEKRESMQGYFTWVVPYTKNITSKFGMRDNPLDSGKQMHRGIDIAAQGCGGKNVLASADGIIVVAQYKNTGYGNCVYINHEDSSGERWETRYAHLNEIYVENNTFVKQGTPIGTIGSTGDSTGNHLHFEILYKGCIVDPLLLIEN